jgi:hypothetical protein
MTIRNVTIGDIFVASNDTRTKRTSKVIDFIEGISLVTGEKNGNIIPIGEKEFMGKKERFETAFTTIVRNRVFNVATNKFERDI